MGLEASEIATPPADQPSRDPRTKVLLTARIVAGRIEASVRIRNMSASGAMIEGSSLPPVGAQLTLIRSDCEVGAEVVWASAGKCGVRFAGSVAVADWVAGSAASSRVRTQAQIDALQADIRSGALPPPVTEKQPSSRLELGELDARLVEEVAYLRRLVETIGDELSNEPLMLSRHMRTLQQFDVLAQALGHVAAVLGSDDRLATVEAIGMLDMRNRLLRKAMFKPPPAATS